MGTLTQNTERQFHSASSPPRTSPMNEPAIPATMLMPSAMPRCLAGNASVMIAAELAMSIDPPTAWATRQPMSHRAPAAAAGARGGAGRGGERSRQRRAGRAGRDEQTSFGDIIHKLYLFIFF